MTFLVSTRSDLGFAMQSLVIPNHPGLADALGRLAIAHTHLELSLRYTVKTLTGLTVTQALDATSEERTSDTRRRIRRLFIAKTPTQDETVRLDALLGKAKRLSEKRNEYLHTAWSVSSAGEPIIKLEDHSWGPAPTKVEVEQVAADILSLGMEINRERLHGFIERVAKKLPAQQTPQSTRREEENL